MTPLSKQPSREWIEAKKIVNKADKPNLEKLMEAPKIFSGSHGNFKKEFHDLKKGSILLFRRNKIEIFYRWAVCFNCQDTRWEKFVAYDNENDLTYVKYLIKKGETVVDKKDSL